MKNRNTSMKKVSRRIRIQATEGREIGGIRVIGEEGTAVIEKGGGLRGREGDEEQEEE